MQPFSDLPPPSANADAGKPVDLPFADKYTLSFSRGPKTFAVLLSLVNFFSTAQFILNLQTNRPFAAPSAPRFASIMALPIGLGLLAMSLQTVTVNKNEIESRHLFSRRRLNRATSYVLKTDSVSYWITDDQRKTKIRVHQWMGQNALRLFDEVTAAKRV